MTILPLQRQPTDTYCRILIYIYTGCSRRKGQYSVRS